MLSAIRKRMTPATVIATVALIFAMTGGAYAANKFLITSTKQISPKVLKALKGANGKTGANGLAGPVGAAGVGTPGAQGPAGAAGAKGETGPGGAPGSEGKAGKEGKEGKAGTTGFTETLPSGKSETGAWAVNAYNVPEGGEVVGPISFAIPLPSASSSGTNGVVLSKAETDSGARPRPSGCEGTLEEPTAPAGKLCVYTRRGEVVNGSISSATTNLTGEGEGFQVAGAGVEASFFEEGGKVQAYGTWAVTAP
jgi:hypothetical protein